MPKERSINPAQAERKKEKAKAVKKGKAEAATRRNEKLSKRNPERLQTQLDELKAVQSSGGSLTKNEKSILEALEKDLKAIKKAREALGDAAPKFGSGTRGGGEGRGGFGGRGGRGGHVLGKRRRDGESSESDSDVPEDVKSIPMPRDTPPPIPKDVLDKWYAARRERMGLNNNSRGAGSQGTSANRMPLGENARDFGGGNATSEEKPAERRVPVESKTVYEAKPILRDLRKEAVAFVPAAVRVKMEKGKGIGGLVEPEEADKLEREGYMGTARLGEEGESGHLEGNDDYSRAETSRAAFMEEVEDEDG